MTGSAGACYEPVLTSVTLEFFPPGGATTEAHKKAQPDRIARNWSLLKFSSLGIEMAVAIFIGWGIGYWLDLQLGTYPWLMMLFFFCGVGAAGKAVYRAAREAQAIMDQSAAEDRGGPRAGGGGENGETRGEATESNQGVDAGAKREDRD